MSHQAGILMPLPKHSRYLLFSFEGSAAELNDALEVLIDIVDGENTVLGIGPSLIAVGEQKIADLRVFPAMSGPGFDIPSTQYALWFWLRGDDRGELYHRSRGIEQMLSLDFLLNDVVEGFVYDANRDLTGYEDGTENPQGENAKEAALVGNQGAGKDGSSFVAVQQWRHDFDVIDAMLDTELDNAIGRSKGDNTELPEAPAFAHVKRTAQESFNPEAFLVRRSMAWVEGSESGLHFVAFGRSLDAFEAQLNRMTGKEDGIVDGLFKFSRPLTGGYYWCPPMKDGKLDLRALV